MQPGRGSDLKWRHVSGAALVLLDQPTHGGHEIDRGFHEDARRRRDRGFVLGRRGLIGLTLVVLEHMTNTESGSWSMT